MTTQEETTFQEALTALQTGENKRARDLLTRLIKINQGNPEYWLYMSTVVESQKELVFCLQETLKRDPRNATARRGLILQGELSPDPELTIPPSMQRRNWEAKYFEGQPIPGLVDKPSPVRLGLILGGIALLVVVIVVVTLNFNRQEVPAFLAWIQRYTPGPTSDITAMPTAATRSAGAPTTQAETPGASFVLHTSTPLPLYINTQHPRTESYRSAQGAIARSDWAGAINFLQQAIKEDPKADLYYLLGESNRNLKKTKEALAAYEQAIATDPRFAPAYLGRARVRMQTNPDLVDAIRADLDKAILLDANLLDATLELAGFKTSHKDAPGALRDLENLLQQQPASPLPYAFRARTYLALNQPDLAVADARRANQMDPGSLSGYRLLAETLRAAGDFGGCVAPLEIYTRYAPEDAEALAWLGQAYVSQGNIPYAQRALDLAVAANPQSFEARIVRAFVFIELKDARKAQDELRAAAGLRADAFIVSLGLGRAALLTSDASEAWRNFSSALRLSQNDAEKAQAYYWRALALEMGKQVPQALADWVEFMRLPTLAIPAGLRVSALEHMQALYTPTPTLRPTTPAPTLPATRTLTPSVTPSPSFTPNATTTPAPTASATP